MTFSFSPNRAATVTNMNADDTKERETKTTKMYSAVKINARNLRSCAVHTGQIINTRRFGSGQRYDRID